MLEKEFTSLWAHRMNMFLAEDMPCLRFHVDDDGGGLGCIYAVQDVCLLSLPECAGRCTRYMLKSQEID